MSDEKVSVERKRTPARALRSADPAYPKQWVKHVRSKCVEDSAGCWLWQGFKNYKGYAFTSFASKNVHAHRKMWEIANNRVIPKGQLVCHTCDVRHCLNPAHLWLGSPADNSLDMVKKGRCHEWTRKECPKGHPYDEVNTTWKVAKSGRPARECRQCVRIRSKQRYHRRKAAQLGAAT